ncbi:MFS transporter [Streptomyces sp. SID1328]|uniref:MFS transporter n=1 Tax=Streptomyces sp. SID1328 TaxID=2690250 RepID=UPI00136CCB06|nr:MFS transporter [Streptomyces sp. SID1328]MYV40968.1 MFS transporter [Streptomyces sp. SID1328]
MAVTSTQHASYGEATTDRLGARGWLALLTLCGATFMTGLDYSVVTVALPEIGRNLHFADTGSLQWVSTACLLPTASLLPLFSRVSDLVGRHRLFTAGVALFAVFSLLAGLAIGPATLIAARVGQGVAASMIAPTAIALMTTVFPEGPRRTRALGINGAVLSLGFVIGTLGGGVITSGLSWRWTMLILVIIGVLVLAGALALLPRTDVRSRARLDAPGAVLATVGLFALVYAISTGAQAGWGSASTAGSLVLAVVALSAFLLVERRHPDPLIPLAILNRATVKWSVLLGFITLGMCGGSSVLLSLYMQDVLGYSALATGAGFLAEGLTALVAGMFAARIIERFGKVATISTGLLVQGVGTALMVFLPEHGGLVLLLVTSGAMGFGHVLTVVSFITTITSGLPDDEQGIAGGLSQLPQFLGAIGTAALAAIVTARSKALAPTTTSTLATLGGLHAAMLTAGIVCLAGAVLALVCLRRPVAMAN